MKTPGFSILEIIMVMAVSAIIMTALLEIYNQTARNMTKVERFIFEDTQILTLKNRFGKDSSGITAIWFKQSELAALQAAQEKKEAPKNTRKLSYFFHSTNKNDQFEMLAFITTAALQSYSGDSERFVRVVYLLENDPVHEGLFRLMRKEVNPVTEFVDEQGLKQGKFYELIGGIKSLHITYQLVDRVALNKQLKAGNKPKDASNAKDTSEDEVPIIRSVTEWHSIESVDKPADKENDNLDDDKEKRKDLGGAPVPRFIEIKIVFGKTESQVEKEYQVDFYIPSTVDNMPKSIFSIKPSVKKSS